MFEILLKFIKSFLYGGEKTSIEKACKNSLHI